MLEPEKAIMDEAVISKDIKEPLVSKVKNLNNPEEEL